MSPWTLPFDLYPWFAVISSVGLLVLFVIHLRRVTRTRREGVSVLTGLVLVVVSLGLCVSSLAAYTHLQVDAVVGLAIVRGALLVGAIVLWAADRHGGDGTPE